VGALAVLGGIGALVGHASGHVTPKGAVTATQVPKAKAAQSKAAQPKATVKPQPAATVTVTTTAPPPAATQPAATQPAATQPAAPPADSILAKFYGTGSGNTGTSTVPSDQLAGSQAYFQVITDDAHWELVVVSGTS
jgi:hypothetical protein